MNSDEEHEAWIDKLIEDCRVDGLTFDQHIEIGLQMHTIHDYYRGKTSNRLDEMWTVWTDAKSKIKEYQTQKARG